MGLLVSERGEQVYMKPIGGGNVLITVTGPEEAVKVANTKEKTEVTIVFAEDAATAAEIDVTGASSGSVKSAALKKTKAQLAEEEKARKEQAKLEAQAAATPLGQPVVIDETTSQTTRKARKSTRKSTRKTAARKSTRKAKAGS